MMNGDKNHRPPVSAADIEQYLQGKLSPQQMHALEMAAQHDPFLSDALEGMEAAYLSGDGEAAIQSDVKDLEKRLSRRSGEAQKKQVYWLIPATWMRISAAILLLGGLTLLSYYFLSHQGAGIAAGQRDLSVVKPTPTALKPVLSPGPPGYAPPPGQKPPSINTPGSSTHSMVKHGHPDQEKPRAFNPLLAEKESATSQQISGPPQAEKGLMARSQADRSKAAEGSDLNTTVPDSAVIHLNTNAGVVKTEGHPAGSAPVAGAQGYFSGKITDYNHQPVIGAAVLTRGEAGYQKTPKAYVTDRNGEFRMPLDRPDSMVHVRVESVGYEPVSAVIIESNQTANLIVLKPTSSALNEVVVSAMGSGKNPDPDEQADAPRLRKQSRERPPKAVPAAGWPEYSRYISDHKHIATADSVKKGKEIISFLVNRRGELSGFRVEQGISPAHDRESIRLIREGPAWKLLQGRKSRARLAIDF